MLELFYLRLVEEFLADCELAVDFFLSKAEVCDIEESYVFAALVRVPGVWRTRLTFTNPMHCIFQLYS